MGRAVLYSRLVHVCECSMGSLGVRDWGVVGLLGSSPTLLKVLYCSVPTSPTTPKQSTDNVRLSNLTWLAIRMK